MTAELEAPDHVERVWKLGQYADPSDRHDAIARMRREMEAWANEMHELYGFTEIQFWTNHYPTPPQVHVTVFRR